MDGHDEIRDTESNDESLAMYIRVHLLGASAGLRLAQLLKDDPWMAGALDQLPRELAEEAEFARQWAATKSRLTEIWTLPVFGFTALAGTAAGVLRPLRGSLRRAVALEAMRSLVLAKKAMWEVGLYLNPVDTGIRQRLLTYDEQALRQAEQLQELHRKATQETFGEAEPVWTFKRPPRRRSPAVEN